MMSVVIKNFQKSTVLNLWTVRRDLLLLRSIMGLHSFNIGLIFLSSRKMKELNAKYRSIHEPTDILSFPVHSHINESTKRNISHEERDLGDIFLCPQVIKSKYEVEDHNIRKIFVPLLTHGLCHLCGYLHDTEEQYEMMHNKEIEILQLFSKKTGKVFFPA